MVASQIAVDTRASLDGTGRSLIESDVGRSRPVVIRRSRWLSVFSRRRDIDGESLAQTLEFGAQPITGRQVATQTADRQARCVETGCRSAAR